MVKKLGSLAALRAKVEGNRSGGLTYIPRDQPLKVLFLSEPDEWVSYINWFDPSQKKGGIVEEWDDVPEGARGSERFAAVVLDVDTQEQKALEMPKTLVEGLYGEVTMKGSLRHSEYLLMKRGAGLDTSYLHTTGAPVDATPDPEINLVEVVDGYIARGKGGADNGDAPGRAPVRKSKAPTPSAVFAAEDDDEELFAADEADPTQPPFAREWLTQQSGEVLVELARRHGVPFKGRTKSVVIGDLLAVEPF